MTEYTFHRETVSDGDEIEVPNSARKIDYDHREALTIVCWMEKKGESVY